MKLIFKTLFIVSLFSALPILCANRDESNKPEWKTHIIDASRGALSGVLQFMSDEVFQSWARGAAQSRFVGTNHDARNEHIRNLIFFFNLANILLDSKKSLTPTASGIFKRLMAAAISHGVVGIIKNA